MSNILPEVRPEVVSMPMEGFVMQTGGSARRSRISFDKYDDSYSVVGVPGHTHNACAVVSVIADYSRKRETAMTVSRAFAHIGVNAGTGDGLAEPDTLVLLNGSYVDSVPVDREAERFDRAIERGVGRISLFPENCQHFIQEPTRSISEIRTIVTSKRQLDSLTYVDEMSGWVDKDGDIQAQNFGDIRVSAFGYIVPFAVADYVNQAGQVDAGLKDLRAGSHPAHLFATGSGFVHPVFMQVDGDGNRFYGFVQDTDGGFTKQWDGSINFVWDNEQRRYRSEEFVAYLRTAPVKLADRNRPAGR